MGEYADMAIDAGIDDWSAVEDEDGNPSYPRFQRRSLPRLKTCNRCATQRLFWLMTDDGWRLHTLDENDDPVMHRCPRP